MSSELQEGLRSGAGMGSLATQNIILLGGLGVQIVTLCYLIKYVRATKGIQEAANQQTEVSQGLLRAANDQAKASSDLMSAANSQAAASEKLARWQTEQWRRDSRGQEWRELIGTLTATISKIQSGPPPHPFMPRPGGDRSRSGAHQLMENMREALATQEEHSHWQNEALFAAARVMSDRLLIADVLEAAHVRDDWKEIERMSHELPLYSQDLSAANGNSETDTVFQQRWAKLRKELVELAQQDLGVAVSAVEADIARG